LAHHRRYHAADDEVKWLKVIDTTTSAFAKGNDTIRKSVVNRQCLSNSRYRNSHYI